MKKKLLLQLPGERKGSSPVEVTATHSANPVSPGKVPLTLLYCFQLEARKQRNLFQGELAFFNSIHTTQRG